MIIARTPFRVSFAGGGTDLHAFYQHEYGAVLSTTINKYVYVTVKSQNRLHDYRIRVSYSVTETVKQVEQVQHPIVREALKLLEIDQPLEITTMADIPAKTGLGSSSSFAVGLLHALHAFKGEYVNKERLAQEAAHIEIDLLRRPIGKQDHYAAAYGGLNLIRFMPNEEVCVDPVICPRTTMQELFSNLLLFYTNITRDASSILKEQQANTDAKLDYLVAMRNQAHALERLLQNDVNLNKFGEILHQAWMNKRKLALSISNPVIDRYFEMALEAGAIGGKLCGAGGGGFLLFYVERQRQPQVREALADLIELEFNYEPQGSKIIFYDM